MVRTTTTVSPVTVSAFPFCVSFFCTKYWTFDVICGWFFIIVKLAISSFILTISCFGNSHYMKSFTVAIFIPLLIYEFSNIYLEVIDYKILFCNSEREMIEFELKWIDGTSAIRQYAQYYVHYSTLFLANWIMNYSVLAFKGKNFPICWINFICLGGQVFSILMLIIIGLNGLHPVYTARDRFDHAYPHIFTFALSLGLLFNAIYAGIAGVQKQINRPAELHKQCIWSAAYGLISFIFFIPSLCNSTFTIFTENESSTFGFLENFFSKYRILWLAPATIGMLPPYRERIFCQSKPNKIANSA